LPWDLNLFGGLHYASFSDISKQLCVLAYMNVVVSSIGKLLGPNLHDWKFLWCWSL